MLSSTVASSEKPEDFRPYLCYNLLNPGLDEAGKTFETILKDIDVDDDGIADVNISYENAAEKRFIKIFLLDLLVGIKSLTKMRLKLQDIAA